ncbi:hypothetical protein JAAARDRAFT_126654 [Jaapia argillacea MUCL 33604]|uniref:Endonuclease III homolog n=1 Tax=Jaapia argillacea MUCL 33604 TaxID=933084 RepID=A0A067PYI2_9AGAM|nr:hypothetical protein JAAARDRAFT_126654 [Jaapia argillacea MUCL 33604]
MSFIKRASTLKERRLSTRPSPYHLDVTLVEAESVAESSNAVSRRSQRVKRESADEPLTEIESLAPGFNSEPSNRARQSSSSPVKRTGSASPRKPKLIPQTLGTPHPTPPRWKETYDTIKEMRSHIVAPVDTMGCDQAQNKEVDPKNRRFATLVSLMLSSQTKDEVTDAAVTKLRQAIGGTLSVAAVMAADEQTVSDAIGKVGFWRRKTQYIKQTAQKLHDEFDSDVPKTVDELCSLPGVGPKMAFLTLQVAWNLNHGIGVDVHVHRITNRLGWHKPPTKNPEQTRLLRLNLQSWLPTELHGEINHMLVGFGQTICLPVGPRCDLCQLSPKGLCPSARTVVKSKSRKSVALTESGPGIEIAIESNLVETQTLADSPSSLPSPLTEEES